MGVIVQIASGPLAGRKKYLRAGQVLRIGRTEWSDFSVPHDTALADVHFALSCDSAACYLKDLGSAAGTQVNGKKLSEAILKHNDRITAGGTTFVVQYEGMAGDPALVAAGIVAAAPTGSMVTSGFKQVEPVYAKEVCQKVELDDGAKQLLLPTHTCRMFFELLVASELLTDAARFLAHAVPKREAVWWGACCVRTSAPDALKGSDGAAVAAAETWVLDPVEAVRRKAMAAAEATRYETAAGWAAAAAAWSGGSLAPPEFPDVPPGETLSAQAVVTTFKLAAVAGDPRRGREQMKAFLKQGSDIADGLQRWPEKPAEKGATK